MRRTILPEEMKLLEKQYMDQTGVSGIMLMEKAADAVCDTLESFCHGRDVLFLCGPGNNGGDGYAAARIWMKRGGKSTIWELSGQTSGDAFVNRQSAIQMGIPVFTLSESTAGLPPFPDVDVISDALFGTGLTRSLTGVAADLVQAVNASGIPVVSVDIPSGINGTDGSTNGPAVNADETVTFHRIKQGLVLADGIAHSGNVSCHSILIPEEWGNVDGLVYAEPRDLHEWIPPRRLDSHKGTFGRCVIFAGSWGMAGAAALCAKACIKAGAGLTTILCRNSILPILQTVVPAATCVSLPEKEGKISEEAGIIAEKAFSHADRIVVGCGIGMSEDNLIVLRKAVKAACPVIWDADALNLISAVCGKDFLPLKPSDFITPHPGEAARLLACEVSEIRNKSLETLKRLQAIIGCNVLLKGARTLMTDGRQIAVNIVGSPALAKGGSGDVLAGILCAVIGRLCVTDHPSLREMQAAVLVHGAAGLRAAQIFGEDHVTPEDLIQNIRFHHN